MDAHFCPLFLTQSSPLSASSTDEYRNHTSCISEAERYEKSIYRGTRKLDESGTGHRTQHQKVKKLTPQEAWNQTIHIAAEKAPQSLKSYMDQLTMLENVPRKEKQFRNFTVNSLKLRGAAGEKVKDEIWMLLVEVREGEKKRVAEEEDEKTKQHSKPTAKKEEEKAAKQSKSKAVSITDDEPSNNTNSDTFAADLPSQKAVKKAMKKALKKAPNKQLKFKALRKKVQDSLSFKVDKAVKKKWKQHLQQCIDVNPKSMILNGKTVSLK